MKILFFGSSDDSVTVVESLIQKQYAVAAVITQPPRPVGRKQILTPTPVETWAHAHKIAVLSFPNQKDKPTLFENEADVTNTLETFTPELLVSASYGQFIPAELIGNTKHGGINIHPSLLPRWRGADPIPWSILSGDHQTGVTLVTLENNFDGGKIVAQKKIPLTETDTHLPLRQKLFETGAELLVEMLPKYLDGSIPGTIQNEQEATVARRLTREDGFIPWQILDKAIHGETVSLDELSPFFQQIMKLTTDNPQLTTILDRAIRALSPWPGVWTLLRSDVHRSYGGQAEKRLKILSGHTQHHEGKELLIVGQVQLEGKNPMAFGNFVL